MTQGWPQVALSPLSRRPHPLNSTPCVHPSYPSYSSFDMNYTVTWWLIQQLLEFMSSSGFLNEMHVGEYLALKMETRPVSPSPKAEEDG